MKSGLDNRVRRLPWLLFLSSFAVPYLAAQNAVVRFTYENSKLQPEKYVIELHEDGTGHYRSEPSSLPGEDAQVQPPSPQDRSIHVSRETREAIFAVARKNKFFAFRCEDAARNIAFQGMKTLQYDGPDGKGSCTYNWSRSAQINKLTDQFEAIAVTLEEGGKLQREYEHGRLSLDAEMELLAEMVKDGRATEVENIAPILQTLAGDEAILQRVQRRARALLEQAKTD